MSDPLLVSVVPVLFAFAVGTCVGSFLNVVIHRVPRGLSIVRPPSACPSCGHRIRPWENVPIVAWLALRGRCSSCAARIPFRYPAIELGTGVLAAGSVWWFGPGLAGVSSFVLLSAMLAVAVIDWEHMIIPDSISLGLLGLGLLLSPWTAPGPVGALVGAAVGGGLLLVTGLVWEKLRGVEAMGGGDVKLMAAVGAFLGVGGALLVIFVGAFLGAVTGVVLMRRGGQEKLAFGTFLAAATAIVVFVGPDLVHWYLSTLRPPA